MRAVFLMDCPYQLYHLFTVDVALGRRSFFPLVIPGAAYTHKAAYIPDGIVPGQQVHYFELFSLKRTYSRSPASFI